MKIQASKRLKVTSAESEKFNPFGNNVDTPKGKLNIQPAKPADPEIGKKLAALATKIVAILKESDDEMGSPKIGKTDLGVEIILGKATVLDLTALQEITKAVKKYNPTDGAILYIDVVKGKLRIEVCDSTALGL